jgi:hypothetical protein
VGVVLSPGDTFGHVVGEPRPVGMLLFVAVASAVITGLFFATETGQQAWLTTAINQIEARGQTIPDAQFEMMETISGVLVFILPVLALVIGPVIWMLVAGILKGAFAVIAGGEATFRHVLDVVATSSVIFLLRSLFVLPINYIQESMDGVSNLGAFVRMLPEGSFVVRFLSMIDLFAVWWVAVLAIGLAVLYRRSTRTIAITLYALYGVIALAIAGVLTLVGGS